MEKWTREIQKKKALVATLGIPLGQRSRRFSGQDWFVFAGYPTSAFWLAVLDRLSTGAAVGPHTRLYVMWRDR